MKTTVDLEKLKYPIGKFRKLDTINQEMLEKWISDIEHFPIKLIDVTKDLNDAQLSWRYRPDGWCIKQTVHHIADSHMNAYIRYKLSLTEDVPTIRPYLENKWAELPDAWDNDLRDSLELIRVLHRKWVKFLRTIPKEGWKLEYYHPEQDIKFSLAACTGLYAWHSNHHLAHIDQAIRFKGGFNT